MKNPKTDNEKCKDCKAPLTNFREKRTGLCDDCLYRRIATRKKETMAGERVRTTDKATKDLINSLEECLDIMRFYHKAALPENLEDLAVCDNPECCGHCIAVIKADKLLGILNPKRKILR